MSKKVGFFGGSFDPIHLGHLNIAIELAEKHKLDEVFICPTSQSPFKKAQPPIASKEHRRAMVTAAISPLPNFTLLDLELQKSMPCYTIDTIRALIAIDQQHKKKKSYFLLLGEDAIEHFHEWREVEELDQACNPSHWKPSNRVLSIERTDISALFFHRKGIDRYPHHGDQQHGNQRPSPKRPLLRAFTSR